MCSYRKITTNLCFSWHEMGVYDLPAEIDYVLKETSQEDLFYIGHSMGTTMFYVLQSEKPEYSSKIRHMISLAPIAYMGHVTSVLAKVGAFFPGGQVSTLLLLLSAYYSPRSHGPHTLLIFSWTKYVQSSSIRVHSECIDIRITIW